MVENANPNEQPIDGASVTEMPDQEADIRAEMRQMRADREADRRAREEADAKHAEELAQMRRDLAFAKAQPPAPTGAGQYEAPSWVKPEHSDVLVEALRAHGDQPRSAGIALAEGLDFVLGVRQGYLIDDVGRVATFPVRWSDLGQPDDGR